MNKKKILKPRQQSKVRVVAADGKVWFNKDGIWTDKPYLKRISQKIKSND